MNEKMKILIIILTTLLMSCTNSKEKLIKKINSLGFPKNEIALTLEDFFQGNTDSASIGANIYPEKITIKDFYYKLKKLKGLESVDYILVRIIDIETGTWPSSDAIYIITNLSKEQIKEQLKELKPDEIYDGWLYKKPVNAPELKPNMKVYTVWWD
jgi:hypothetical protein